MAINSTVNKVQYSGNGSTTPFAFPYYFLADGDLVVILTVDATGVETVQTITTHYTVAGAGGDAGGTVTMVTAPANGETLTIYRDPAITQGVDLRENDSSPSEAKEEALDRLTMICQRLDEQVLNSIKLSEGVVGSFDPTLPTGVVGEAGVSIITNPAGTAFIVGPTAAEIAAAEAEATAAAASAAAALVSENAAAASASSILAAIPYRDVVYVTVGDSPLTITAADAGKFYAIDASGGAITINLPSIALVTSTPKAFGFKKTDSSVNKITLVQNGSDEIDEAAANLLIESQNAAYMMLADTDATPDSWTSLAYGGGNGIGGGTPIKWSEQALAPIKTIQDGIESYDFEDTITQYLYAFLKVPESYISGGQIKMRSLFFTATTSGNVLLTGLTTLIRPGTDAMSSTTNQHTSVNTAVTVDGVSDVPTEAVIDLTDTAGDINSVGVSAGDLLLIRITRDTATDTLADQARVLSESSEVTYV